MDVNIIEISCSKCQATFWVTAAHNNRLKVSHKPFYCPNGHPQHYAQKTEEERAIEDRDLYKRWYKSEQETSRRLNRSNSALRGVITRQRNK